MNRYNLKYGYHSPKKTEDFANLLIAEGIQFEDESWHNDMGDSFSVKTPKGNELRLWVGDAKNEECPDNCIQLYVKNEDDYFDYEKDLLNSHSVEETIDKLKEFLKEY